MADECPHVGFGILLQKTACDKIAIKPRLVDRLDRPEPHRYRRELPKVWHQMWMRIRRYAAGQFAPESLEMLSGEPAFEKSACVIARCRVPLEINHVRRLLAIRPAEEMIEADFVERGLRSVC